MYNILVVEDEYILREGIEEILRENNNLNVFSAKNGKIALEIIEKNKINGMILDIKMPQMTGLELLKELDNRKQNITTIILSGYDEFEYAKEAMKYEVIDYVLKPFTPEDVRRIAIKLISTIETKESKEREIEQLKEQIERNKPIIRERFFSDLINKQIDEVVYKEKLKYLNIDFIGEYYQVLLIEIDEIDNYSEPENEETYQIMVMSAFNRIKKYVENENNCELFHLSTGLFVILFNYFSPDNSSRIFEIAEELLVDVKTRLRISLSAGIGERVKGIAQVKTSYNQALHALMYKILLGGGNVINIWDLEKSENTPAANFNEEVLINKIKLNQKSEVIELVTSIFDSIKKSQSSMNLYSLNLICMRIITACMVALERSNVSLEILDNSKWSNPFNDFLKLKSLEDITSWIQKFVINIMDQLEVYRNRKSKSNIEQAKQFIYKNYKNDISLSDIAEYLHLSKNYFGQMFKEETGIPVTEYINMARIKKAKELLANTSLKVYEIAYEVGFNDQHYFSSVFKKIVGLSPTEYRELV